MDILLISLLILFGMLFCVVELLILPGVTLGGILSALCYIGAVYLAFANLGNIGGFATVCITIVLTLIAVVYALRAKTWDRFSLKNKIDGASSNLPESVLMVGERGVAVSRLAPMGKVEIAGCCYEAKSHDVYINAKAEVEIVGFENFSVIVKEVK